MRYSEEFKNNVVARLLGKEVSYTEAVQQYGVSYVTLRNWVGKATAPGCEATANSKEARTMEKLKLPKGMTYLKAYKAVNAQEFMSETDFGQYCRKHGLLAATVEEWALWFKGHPDMVDRKELDECQSELRKSRRESAWKTEEIDKRDREINRKNKALADASTMLMLSKKAQAIWGGKES